MRLRGKAEDKAGASVVGGEVGRPRQGQPQHQKAGREVSEAGKTGPAVGEVLGVVRVELVMEVVARMGVGAVAM